MALKPCPLEPSYVVYWPSVYYLHLDTLLYYRVDLMTDLTYIHLNWEHLGLI